MTPLLPATPALADPSGTPKELIADNRFNLLLLDLDGVVGGNVDASSGGRGGSTFNPSIWIGENVGKTVDELMMELLSCTVPLPSLGFGSGV